MFDSRIAIFFTDVLPQVAVFPGGVGNTQQDQQRFNSLYNGVVEKIFERPHLQEWRERGW